MNDNVEFVITNEDWDRNFDEVSAAKDEVQSINALLSRLEEVPLTSLAKSNLFFTGSFDICAIATVSACGYSAMLFALCIVREWLY